MRPRQKRHLDFTFDAARLNDARPVNRHRPAVGHVWGLHVAVNRTLPVEQSEGLEPFYAEQALDVATALTAYTAGSAYVNHLDDTGRIEVGSAADLAVLDRNILSEPAGELGDARVDQTWVDGRLVYERS